MQSKTITLLFFMLIGVLYCLPAQVSTTANDGIAPYTGPFRPGGNLDYLPPWTTEQLADLYAGNPMTGFTGVGATTIRPVIAEEVLEVFGYDVLVPTFQHLDQIGMKDMTVTLFQPAEWHRDLTEYCPGTPSALFRNLYEPIWDGGANGTPINENNFFANFVYKTVTTYDEYVKFWEIWNEPGFDKTGNLGWRQPGDPQGNWWDRDPAPCEYQLGAPIEHFVRTLRVAYEVIKTVSPDDYVAAGGFGFQSFLDAVLRNTDNPNGGTPTPEFPLGGGAYFDYFTLHSYPHFDGTTTNIGANIYQRHSDQAATGFVYQRDFFQQVFDQYGYNDGQYPRKPVLITEFNVPSFYAPGNFFASVEGQRNYVMKSVVNAIVNDIPQIHIFSVGDNPGQPFGFDKMGLYQNLRSVAPGNQVYNEEGIAYRAVNEMTNGTTYDRGRTAAMNLPAGVAGHAFRKADGSYMYMLWAKTTIDQSEAANANYSFPASFGNSFVPA